MKKLTIFFAIVISFTFATAETHEPCEKVLVPEEMSSTKITFELPSYEEYIQSIVKESFRKNVFISENNILDEGAYNKVREAKIKIIESNYQGDFVIMTMAETKKSPPGLIFQEEFISNLVSKNNMKFESYTAFSIKNAFNLKKYVLADPSQNNVTNCIVKNGSYKFAELISIIQK